MRNKASILRVKLRSSEVNKRFEMREQKQKNLNEHCSKVLNTFTSLSGGPRSSLCPDASYPDRGFREFPESIYSSAGDTAYLKTGHDGFHVCPLGSSFNITPPADAI
jgi:hypothetical protein